MKIAVGTTSENKLGYLREALAHLGFEADIFPIAAPSGIPDQPKTSAETKAGSLSRARLALAEAPYADAGLGIEVGYERNMGGRYEMLCWATLMNKNGFSVSHESHRFPLPKFHHELLHGDQNVSEHVEAYLTAAKTPAQQFIGQMIKDRRPFIMAALEGALVRYFNRHEF